MSALQPHYSLHTTSYQEEDYDYDPPVTTLPPIKKAESVSITSISDALRPHIPAEVKLVELSKKLRRVNVSLETEKTRVSTLEKRCKEYESQLRQLHNPVPPRENSAVREAKEAHTKASQMMRKLEEERSAHNISKNELRHLKQLLEREVGSDVDITKLMHNPTLHKFRAEQIVILTDKIQRMEKMPIAPPRQSSQSSINVHRNPLKERSDKEKRLEIDRLKGDNARLAEDAVEARKKTEASIARSRALERDNRDLKAKMGTLLDKLDNDDKLIAALQEQKFRSSAPSSKRTSVAMTPTTTTTADLLATIARLENQLRLNATRTQAAAASDNNWQTRCEAVEAEVSGLRNIIAMLNKRIEEANRTALNAELNLVKAQDELTRRQAKDSKNGRKAPAVPFEKLQNRLDIALDEIQVLNNTMKAMAQSKESELGVYWQLMDELRFKYEASLSKKE